MEVKMEGGNGKLISIVIKVNDHFVSGAQFFFGGGEGHCAGAHQAPGRISQIPKYLVQEPREIHIFL
jgi:hypothetical protein